MQWSRSEGEKMKLPFGGAQGAVFVFLCPLSAMQWSRSEREKRKLPFGCAQGAVFDISLPTERNAVEPKRKRKKEITLRLCS